MHAKNGGSPRLTTWCYGNTWFWKSITKRSNRFQVNNKLRWQNNALDLSSNNEITPSPLIMTLNFTLSIILTYLIALIRIAFFTLLERKSLAYFQIRKGPNKPSFLGLPVPLADAIKLFTKEQLNPQKSNIFPFLLAPTFRLTLALILWALYPFANPPYFIKLGTLVFLCISSLNVYSTLTSGWSSNSKYALLGALRRVAQTISYEVRIALILLSILIIYSSLTLNSIYFTHPMPIGLVLPPLFICWFITILAETNRTPFDLAEGESELVSGFNIEYRSGLFALIFIAEYTRILIIRILTAIFFLPSNTIFISEPILGIKRFLFAFLFLWTRATFPRIRYDQLITLTWKSFLPLALSYLLLILPLSLIN